MSAWRQYGVGFLARAGAIGGGIAIWHRAWPEALLLAVISLPLYVWSTP